MSHPILSLRAVQVTRYVTPLREGGSLPAIAEADDGFLYVLKFRGAGQGVKALIAELIGGEIARALGLRVPEIVLSGLDVGFGRSEPDEEIQDLLKASVGLNLGLHYLSGSMTFDPVANTVDPLLASQIVWLDALLTNVDRTARNTNMLVWNKELWLIDHGAALYFHHSWGSFPVVEQATKPFVQIKDHVLLPAASRLAEVDTVFRSLLPPSLIKDIVGLIPEEWLIGFPGADPLDNTLDIRQVYIEFLTTRLASSSVFLGYAVDEQKKASSSTAKR